MPLDYASHQSVAICYLHICVLLSIIITICIQSMLVNLQRKHTLQSRWCLICKLNHTLFLTNVSFIIIIALICTSIMSQLTYVAIIEQKEILTVGEHSVLENGIIGPWLYWSMVLCKLTSMDCIATYCNYNGQENINMQIAYCYRLMRCII